MDRSTITNDELAAYRSAHLLDTLQISRADYTEALAIMEARAATARHMYAIDSLQRSGNAADPKAVSNLKRFDGQANGQRAALARIVGQDAAADLLGESLRSVFAQAFAPGFDTGADGVRSLLVSALGATATGVGREVVKALRTHEGLIGILPESERLERGIGSLKIATMTARPLITDPATEGAAIGSESSPTFGVSSVAWQKAGAYLDAASEWFSDNGIADPAALIADALLASLAADIEAKLCAALFVAGVSSAAAAAAGLPVMLDLVKAANAVREAGWTPTHAVMRPTVYSKLSVLADGGSPIRFQEATGLVPVLSSSAPAAEIMVLDANPAHRVAEVVYRARPNVDVSSNGQTFAADTARYRLGIRFGCSLNVPGGARRVTSA